MTGTRIAQKISLRHGILNRCFLCAALFFSGVAPAWAQATERQQFMDAWNAAGRGDRSAFTSIPVSLQQYELYPYLVYEQLRYQRARIVPAEMATFLEQHADWAFAGGLRSVWLKTLGKQGKKPECRKACWPKPVRFGMSVNHKYLNAIRYLPG
jgi:hypothetical protein